MMLIVLRWLSWAVLFIGSALFFVTVIETSELMRMESMEKFTELSLPIIGMLSGWVGILFTNLALRSSGYIEQ
jgi:hypothetical protein